MKFSTVAVPLRSLRGRLCIAVAFALVICTGDPRSSLSQTAAGEESGGVFKLEHQDGKIRVLLDGELFTEYDYQTYAKPILYPVNGPGGISMMRNHPMRKGVEGEADDHPHHKSIWFAHGDVNGISFWHEKGRIVHQRVLELVADPTHPSFSTDNAWIGPDGQTVCTDTTRVTFHAFPGGRAIDLDVTVHASHGDVKFGDTKEGTMAIRTHPRLRLTPVSGGTETEAIAVNSEGDSGKSIWGKSARWVDYSGTIEGRRLGIAIFDHPDNLRHPTTWHARDYGLVAANPFGLYHFKKMPRGAGDFTLANGQDLQFRYRIVIHDGDAEEAHIEKRYKAYASSDL